MYATAYWNMVNHNNPINQNLLASCLTRCTVRVIFNMRCSLQHLFYSFFFSLSLYTFNKTKGSPAFFISFYSRQQFSFRKKKKKSSEIICNSAHYYVQQVNEIGSGSVTLHLTNIKQVVTILIFFLQLFFFIRNYKRYDQLSFFGLKWEASKRLQFTFKNSLFFLKTHLGRTRRIKQLFIKQVLSLCKFEKLKSSQRIPC